MHLDDSVTILKNIKKTQVAALKRLGISTLRDLLYHFPVRYSDMSSVKLIKDTSADETVTIYGTISNLQTKKAFRSKVPMASGVLTDIENTSISIIWFNQAFIAKQFKDGEIVKLTGKVTENKDALVLTNPEIERAPDLPIDRHDSLFSSDDNSSEFGYAVYRESRGITSRWITHSIRKIINAGILDELADSIPDSVRTTYNLPDIRTAFIWIHNPRKKDHADAARKRFSFEEIFFIQLAQQKSRHDYQQHHSFTLSIDTDTINTFVDRFPFTPTEAQSRTINEALRDMSSGHPMSRLIEGDVGSGKTFVAATIAYAVTKNRPRIERDGEITQQDFGALQVAYMAPTEVLATQLFENFIEYFRGSGMQIALMTGSGCRKFPSKVASAKDDWTKISKTQLLKWIANGEIPIVVGTHALISKKVQFKDLGLVIIDEQHRFGTKQRKNLARKDNLVPHYLSMSATPIPRTLAMTIYGDLDLSVIDEMPVGRKNVITEIVRTDRRDDAYTAIQKQLDAGRQAYIICPRIDPPTPNAGGRAGEHDLEKEITLQLKSVTSEAERLSTDIFPDARIAIMHSKMKPAEKEAVMTDFHNHKIDILVSTSVIEVGVNVPNATVIVIEGAERFGLAQLHQLRGRVLRGTHQPYCYLFMSDSHKGSDVTTERLTALAETSNGFELAEKDMMMRGIGDLAGNKQWGISDLGMEAIKNPRMVEAARSEAKNIIKVDPTLDKHLALQDKLVHGNDVHFE